jgi:Na+-translocating ferredoxin:NAD+ oxidoreductase RNF subunit RnfB
MNAILIPTLIIGGIGIVCGVVLALASIVMAVPTDKKVEKIKSVLPGANCGACGYPSCEKYAVAVSKEEAPINGCPPGGAAVVSDIAEIVGSADVDDVTRQIAIVLCRCCDMMRAEKLNYQGELTCTYASQLYGGPTACFYACQGFGDCVPACEYDAIRIVNGLAVVDSARCIGCTLCVPSCPKGLIQMAPVSDVAVVHCASRDWGPNVRQVCTLGCIGCSRCVRVCERGAVKVENFLAKVDYEKCVGCGECINVCPTGIIYIEKSQEKK